MMLCLMGVEALVILLLLLALVWGQPTARTEAQALATSNVEELAWRRASMAALQPTRTPCPYYGTRIAHC